MIAINMDMPTICKECPFCKFSELYYNKHKCMINNKLINTDEIIEKRNEKCPLIMVD